MRRKKWLRAVQQVRRKKWLSDDSGDGDYLLANKDSNAHGNLQLEL